MQRWLPSMIVVLFPILSNCASGGSNERESAAQEALDTKLSFAQVDDGYQCPDSPIDDRSPLKYTKIPGAHVGPTVTHNPNADHGAAFSYIKGEPCRLVSWDADVPLQNHLGSIAYITYVNTFWTSLATTRTSLASFMRRYGLISNQRSSASGSSTPVSPSHRQLRSKTPSTSQKMPTDIGLDRS